MTRYSTKLKEQINKRVMPPNWQGVTDVTRDTGISAPLLYAWPALFTSDLPRRPKGMFGAAIATEMRAGIAEYSDR